MTSHKILTISAAIAALATAQSASAQNYNVSGNGYEFAVPADDATAMAPPMMQMQQMPMQQMPMQPVNAPRIMPSTGYQNFAPQNAPMAPQMQHMAYQQMPQMPQQQMGQNFDREDFLKQCKKEVRNKRSGFGSSIGPGLVTAAIGGVAGNRLYKKERLAGALIGGGAGGLLGLALGALVDSISSKSEAHKYCTAFLDRQMSGNQNAQGNYSQGNYSQGMMMQQQSQQMMQQQYQGQMMWVPVMVQVPQRAVVRDVVEYVDAPRQPAQQPRTIVKEVVIERVVERQAQPVVYRQAEPVRSKRLKYVKHR